MTAYYGFETKSGICRTFRNESALIKWLENKNFECESPEAFNKWLEDYFECGNEISIYGNHYSYLDCIELA